MTDTTKQRNRLSTEQLVALRNFVAEKTAHVERGQRPDLGWLLIEAQHAMPFAVTAANVRTAWQMRRTAETSEAASLKVVAANVLRLCRVMDLAPLEPLELERIAQSG